jgi:hypothetical protein
MVSYANSLQYFFRINFIGRPFELNKLVYDQGVILYSQQEADLAIKAMKNFKGYQYIGQVLTINFLFLYSAISKKLKLQKNTQILLVLNAFTIGAGFYYYSHFSYWHLIRDLIKTTREREKNFSHLNKNQIEEYKILHNQSKDYHEYIKKKVGFINCILEVLRRT